MTTAKLTDIQARTLMAAVEGRTLYYTLSGGVGMMHNCPRGARLSTIHRLVALGLIKVVRAHNVIEHVAAGLFGRTSYARSIQEIAYRATDAGRLWKAS